MQTTSGKPKVDVMAGLSGIDDLTRAEITIALVATAGPVMAQEFFIHANGDSINAEIKSFERGKLSYEIPGSSSASLEFQNVATIGSSRTWCASWSTRWHAASTVRCSKASRNRAHEEGSATPGERRRAGAAGRSR